MRISARPSENRTALHKEAQHWLLRLTSGTATAYDARAFKLWCAQSHAHLQAFAEMRRMWDSLGPAAAALAARETAHTVVGASAVHFSVDDIPRFAARRMSRRAFLGGAVAASAAWMVLRPPMKLWPSLSEMAADYRTATGEQRDIEIKPDLIVHMNTQTTVNLRKGQGNVLGIELLEGEIQVRDTQRAHTPFTVFARGGRVEIGAQTHCNIRCFSSDIQVTGLDGTSTLTYQGQSALVHAAQRVDYGASGIGSIVAADVEATMAWRRRVLIFDGRTLADVIEEINRYRPGKIVLANDRLSARKVQGRISLNQLADIAALIQDAYGAKVTSLPGGIIVLS